MRSWLYRLCNVCRQDIHIFKLPCATYQFYLINLVTMMVYDISEKYQNIYDALGRE